MTDTPDIDALVTRVSALIENNLIQTLARRIDPLSKKIDRVRNDLEARLAQTKNTPQEPVQTTPAQTSQGDAEAAVFAALDARFQDHVRVLKAAFAEAIAAIPSAPAGPSPASLQASAVAEAQAAILSGLDTRLQQHIELLKAQFEQTLAEFTIQTSEATQLAIAARAAVDAMEVRINKWIAEDRYTITRAQIREIMREHND